MALSYSLKSRLRRATPWASPDNCHWRTARFCVVDIETTGLSDRDEIVSIGAVEVRDARITSWTFYEVVKPRCRISEESIRIHALTDDELAHASPIGDVVPRLRDALAGSVIVAHAAWIERAFLDRALRPVGEKVPRRIIDTAALARHAGLAPPGLTEPSLEHLSRQLGLPVHTPHHALGDAQTTAQVLLVLATRLESEGHAVSVDDLVSISASHGN